jgi:hypothetical protein
MKVNDVEFNFGIMKGKKIVIEFTFMNDKSNDVCNSSICDKLNS